MGGPFGEDVHQGDEEQQPGGGELHPAYSAPLLLVRRAEGVHRAVHGGAGPGSLTVDSGIDSGINPGSAAGAAGDPGAAGGPGKPAVRPFHPLHPFGDPSHSVLSRPTPGTEHKFPASVRRGNAAGSPPASPNP
ncbi:hypothetical protein GCM10023220_63810 [Streptomyces ziwulingensis]|uniref:Uncharacterized protein n=1 Tax=Streptomyces ziwulingensis TaxID=1045501 RepID=A0ABP9D0S0_9ACTN